MDSYCVDLTNFYYVLKSEAGELVVYEDWIVLQLASEPNYFHSTNYPNQNLYVAVIGTYTSAFNYTKFQIGSY